MEPLISVIIPSLDGKRGGNLERLLGDIGSQTIQDVEVIVVEGVRPCAKAHNEGARRAKGEFLVSLDDDVRIGDARLFENLIQTLRGDPSIGMAGASQHIPLAADSWQRLVAAKMPRSESPVVSAPVESDMVTHACRAIRRELYLHLGGENDRLLRGDDAEFKHRVRKAGYRICLAPESLVYHPLPATPKIFMRDMFRRGMGAAHDNKFHSNLIYETPYADFSSPEERKPRSRRIVRYLTRMTGALLTGNWILFLAFFLYLAGAAWGWIYWRKPI
ncbi:MAG: glycosyltransferase [Armatimonadetes bacterium]|nr:glycosyltransferase [Armatimonadota bacterium]